jgi:predicted nucleic acid-binding protein
MTASARVLVDTSAWIDFFRKTGSNHPLILQLMAEERVCSCGLVLAELMQGAKSEKELVVLRDFIHVFPFLAESAKNWQEAGELSFRLRRKGKTIGLSVCYIAVTARINEAKILTNDGHFQLLRHEAGITLFTQ